MNNDELLELRKYLSRYTEWNLSKLQDKKSAEFTRLEFVNFIDRANRVVYDIEKQIEVDNDKD